ncbi:MAG: hypothetical protein ABIL70_01705 [candidate division WOR-3 bacterium]
MKIRISNRISSKLCIVGGNEYYEASENKIPSHNPQVHPVRYKLSDRVNPEGYLLSNRVKGLSPALSYGLIVIYNNLFFTFCDALNSSAMRESESAGSETVASYQMERLGTWESHNVPEKVWVAGQASIAYKPEEGEAIQMTLWQSDKPIVARKQSNVCGAKGLTGRPFGRGHNRQAQNWRTVVNKTYPITCCIGI